MTDNAYVCHDYPNCDREHAGGAGGVPIHPPPGSRVSGTDGPLIDSPAVVSSSPDIPDEAVEAFRDAMPGTNLRISTVHLRRGLAAAAPALTRQAVADERVRWLNVTDAVAAEREHIATAIEAERDRQPSLTPSAHLNGYTQAARIARAGGTP